ncbi:MAG: class I SAM-dependent methyltransferase [Pseudomonadota bacterium]
MLGRIKSVVKRIISGDQDRKLEIHWIKKGEGTWLSSQLREAAIKPARTAFSNKIENLTRETNEQGPQSVWKGYEGNNTSGPTRMPDDVCTDAPTGDFFSWLVQSWKPETVVEFGTAFGVSGMYFLAGLEKNQKGHLLTFDPNDVWRKLAVGCLSAISNRFTSVAGTFEENVDTVIAGRTIDIAFIDAIHTREFVIPQLELVLARCSDNAIIILDDINFSDNMRACWQELANDSRFASSVTIGEPVGILEFIRK